MNAGYHKNEKEVPRIGSTKRSLIFLLTFTFVFTTFSFLATAESVKIADMNDFEKEGWIEEILDLPANDEIELDNYTISYNQFFSNSTNTAFIEQISISEKRIDKHGSEKYYLIKSFTGNEKIKELKNKSILLDRDTIVINIESYEYSKLKLKICSKRDVFSEINISTTVPEFILLYQDETISIPIKINNSELIDEIISLKASESDFYAHKFIDDGFRVNKIKLNSGEIKDITLELKIDKYCTPGDYNFTINASGRSSSLLSIPFTVEENTNKSEKSLAVQLSKLYVSGKAGSELTIPIRVTNTGDTDLKEIKLEIKSPAENWDVEVTEKKIDFLKSKEYETVDLTVRIPASAENGDYFVDIKGATDGVETVDTKLRVNVKPQSNSAWVGIGIIISVVLCLSIVYRKYGRR
ncbi:NEW3 domain-containing protein [Methanolobus sp. WCC1]|uniref:COG1470 family protein n=1 Tax=unclassified Methanolobus TaxID=2629569 RepID=UPI0032480A28